MGSRTKLLFLGIRCIRDHIAGGVYIALVAIGNDEAGTSLRRASREDLINCYELQCSNDNRVLEKFTSQARATLAGHWYYIDMSPEKINHSHAATFDSCILGTSRSTADEV